MTEFIKNNPEMLRWCILYEFTEGNPIFKTFKKLCRKFGNEFMDYPEFEFWYMRFAQGKYDLDYDRSLDPKTRSFTDLPAGMFEKIGDSLNLNDRFALRKVSKDIQEFVDSWTPKVTDIDFYDDCFIKDSLITSRHLNYSVKSIENVMSLFKNPKLRLDTLKISRLNDKSKKIFRILEGNNFNKIHVKHFDIHANSDSLRLTPTVLNMLDRGTLEKVTLFIGRRSVGKLDEFLCSEHLKGIKMLNIATFLRPCRFPLKSFQNHPRLSIVFLESYVESELPDFIKNLVNSTQLQICHLSAGHYRLYMERIMREFQSPETMVPGFPDLRRFPIPGSNEFYEIDFNSNDDYLIRIERKQ